MRVAPRRCAASRAMAWPRAQSMSNAWSWNGVGRVARQLRRPGLARCRRGKATDGRPRLLHNTGRGGPRGVATRFFGGTWHTGSRQESAAKATHWRLGEEKGLTWRRAVAVARCGRDDLKQCRAALLRRRSRTGAPAWWRSVAAVRRRGAPPRFLPWRGGGRAPSSPSLFLLPASPPLPWFGAPPLFLDGGGGGADWGEEGGV